MADRQRMLRDIARTGGVVVTPPSDEGGGGGGGPRVRVEIEITDRRAPAPEWRPFSALAFALFVLLCVIALVRCAHASIEEWTCDAYVMNGVRYEDCSTIDGKKHRHCETRTTGSFETTECSGDR